MNFIGDKDRVRMDIASHYLNSDWLTLKHNNQQELTDCKQAQPIKRSLSLSFNKNTRISCPYY